MLLLLVWWCQPQAFFWWNLWFQAWIRRSTVTASSILSSHGTVSSRSTTCFDALDHTMSGLRVMSFRNWNRFFRSTLMSLARIPVPAYVPPEAFSWFNNCDEVMPFCPDVSTRLLPLLLQTCRQFKLYLVVPLSKLTISRLAWQDDRTKTDISRLAGFQQSMQLWFSTSPHWQRSVGVGKTS